MTHRLLLTSAFCALMVAGCSEPRVDQATDSTTIDPAVATADSQAADPNAATAVSATTGQVIPLSPDNAKIVFVGTHVGEPRPRTGGFEKLSGHAVLNPETKALESVTVDIDTTSVWTQIERLTNHLKAPDFFDVNQYPTAKFQSTKIEAGDDGQYTITGDFTLLETTKEISFPATVAMQGEELKLNAEFRIDRTEFGMDYGPDRVESEVALTVAIGEKTERLAASEGGGGGRGGGGGGGGRGNFNPMQSDSNGDGKLSMEEVPERMKERFADLDTNSDGFIDQAEIDAMRARFGGGRGRGGPGGGGGGRPDRPGNE